MTNEELAMRATAVRRNIVKMLTKAGSGHFANAVPCCKAIRI